MAPRKPPTLESQLEPRAPTIEEAEEMRRRDGERLAVNQLVKQSGSGFDVFRDDGKFHVGKDEDGDTVCDCDDWVGATTIGIPKYACVDIYAVRYFVEGKQESMAKEIVAFSGDGEIAETRDVEAAAELVDNLAQTGTTPPESGYDPYYIPPFIARLSAPLPKGLIKQRAAPWDNTQTMDYVDWPTIADLLDKAVGEQWSFEIIKIDIGEFAVSVHAALTIYGVRRDGVGVAEVRTFHQVPKYELAIKAASSDSLKRAAVLFGLGREMYKNDETDAPVGEGRQASFKGNVTSAPSNGYSAGDASARQLGMIRAMCSEQNIDGDRESNAVFGNNVETLSKKQASDFIGHLQALARGQEGLPYLGDAQEPEPAKPAVKW